MSGQQQPVTHWLPPFLAVLLLCLLTGCGPSGREILQAGLERGESLLIFPRPQGHVEWSRDGGSLLSIAPAGVALEGAVRDAGESSSYQVVSVGKKYAAASVPPGTYRLSGLVSRAKAEGRELQGTGEFDSRFGQVRVDRTPRKKYARERVWVPPEYAWVSASDGRGYYEETWPGYWETRTRIDYVTSYLVARLDLASNGNVRPLAAFTVGPGETVLIPAIWGEIELLDGSCRFVGDEAPPGYAELAGTSGTYTAYMGGAGSERDFYNQVYQCPVESLLMHSLARSTLPLPEDKLEPRPKIMHWKR